MAEAKHKKYIIKNKFIQRNEEKAIILTDNGECSLNADVDVMGIQLQFKGRAEITPTLPDGWILQGNNKIIIMFTLQNTPIKNQKLFNYNGYIDIRKAIVSNNKGERLSELIKQNGFTWGEQTFNFDIEGVDWGNFKDTKINGKVKKTIYNLPDYNLPKVEKQTKKISQKTYSRTKTSSGSSGSGGY
mgnify:CR=1 FL=1